jgi:transcriptional regulator with XRE-family HTH domain
MQIAEYSIANQSAILYYASVSTIDRIRSVIASRRWTQFEAARQLGVSQATLSRLLSGFSGKQLEMYEHLSVRLSEIEQSPVEAAS